MKLTYGGYEHDDNEVSFSVNVRQSRDDFGRTRVATVRYTIIGKAQAASVSALTTKLDGLEDAYSQQGQDLNFYDNDGNLTVHYLHSGDCIGGTRVVGFEYIDGYPGVRGSGDEYVFRRTYRIAVEGDQIVRGGLLSWNDTYAYFGDGGPEHMWVETLLTLPQRQTLKQFTTGMGIQTGIAVGQDSYPEPPEPLFPQYVMRKRGDHPMIKPFAPRITYNGELTDFKIAWRYVFEGPTQLAGVPTVRFS